MSYYDTIVLADSPVSYWALADPSGTTAADAADSNPGTYSGGFTLGGAAPHAGMNGSVLYNGTSGYCRVPYASNLGITSSVTVEAWVKLTSSPRSGISSGVAGRTSSGGGSPFVDFNLSAENTSGVFTFAVGTSSFGSASSTTAPVAGLWYHVVGTYDGATIKIYVNGVLEGSAAKTGSIANNLGPLIIGAADTGGGAVGSYFPGAISSVDVCNTALSISQIQGHYWAAINPSLSLGTLAKPTLPSLQSAWSANLLAAYNLGEGTGSTAADLSGNAHTGTLTGGCTWSSGTYGNQLSLADNSTTGSYLALGDLASLSGVTAFTFSALCQLNSYTDSPRAGNLRILIGTARSATSYPQAAIFYHASDQSIHFNARYNNFPDLVAPALPLNQWILITGRITGNVQSLWYDNVKVAEQAVASYSYAADGTTRTGALGDMPGLQTGNNWSGPIAMGLYATRGYSDAEIIALAADPFAWDRTGFSNPAAIPGCKLWLKGDTGVYRDAGVNLATSGQNVVQWNDQSGNGNNASAVANPVYALGVSVDGTLPAPNFNGAGMQTSLSVAAPYTIFCVYKPQSGVHNDVSANVRYIQGLSVNWLIGPRGGFHTNYAGGFVANGSGPAVTSGVIVRTYSRNTGSASSFVVNATDITQSASPVTAPGTIALGGAGSVNEPPGGYLCEVIIYDSALSSGDQTSVDNYLKRWTASASVATAVITEGADTLAGAAGATVPGSGASLAVTEGADTLGSVGGFGIAKPKSAVDLATFTEHPVARNVTSRASASDTATFTELVTERNVHVPVIWTHSLSDSATFSDHASSRNTVHRLSASDVAQFSDLAEYTRFTHSVAQATATFSDIASAGGLRKKSASDTATFTVIAIHAGILRSAASDTATFTDIASEARAISGSGTSATDTATFTDLAESNHFLGVSASSSAIFTDLAISVRVKLGAHDRAIFTDRADAQVLLACGIVVPGGDTSATLRQTLFQDVSGKFPFSYAESPDGVVLMANGLDPMIAWDGVSFQAWTAGVIPPSSLVIGDGSGNGLLTGVRYAFQRWIDTRGNPSNLSPVSDPVDLGSDGFVNGLGYVANGAVTITSFGHGLATGDVVSISGINGIPTANGVWTITVIDSDTFTLNSLYLTTGTYLSGGIWIHGSAQITYANIEIPTDPKIVRRQILRNLEGNAKVFYVDVDTTNLISTTFHSTLSDEELATKTAVPLQFDDKEPASQRFYPPPSHKLALAAYAGRMWATADLIYSEGNVQVSLGSSTVTGSGTAWTTAMVGRLLYVDGSGVAPQAILSVSVASQVLALETPFKGASNAIAFYTIRPAPIERRLVYYTEANLPEAWPPWNAFAIPESSDEIVGIFVNRSFLYVIKERHIYKFAFREEPNKDGYVFPVLARGCINNRCYEEVGALTYLMDEMGVYSFDGDAATSVSKPVQNLFKPDGVSPYRIDWTTDRTLWHSVHDPSRETLRWFVDLVGYPALSHAICYDYSREMWWLENYPEGITSSGLIVVDGWRQPCLGTTSRRVFVLGQGTLDGISEDVSGTLRGTVMGSTPLTLTDAIASFPSNLAGVPVSIVHGTGAGQRAIVSENTATVITLVHPWEVQPDETSVYQIGGIPWIWKSGWRRLADDESENPRDLELVFKPTDSPGDIRARLFYDHSDDPYDGWGYDLSRDGITVVSGIADLVVDLSSSRGYVTQRLSGHRDPYGFGNRYVALEVSGVQGVDPQRIFQVVIAGCQ